MRDPRILIVGAGIAGLSVGRALLSRGVSAEIVDRATAFTGAGPFGFMRDDPMIWVGFIQAYLLMTIVAVLLLLGSADTNPRKWNAVGALAHCPPLIAALASLDTFRVLGAGAVVWIPIAFHVIFLLLESTAVAMPERHAKTA